MFDFQFEGKGYSYPDSLSKITLGQRIAWQEFYGQRLEERAIALAEMPEGFDKEIAGADLYVDGAIQSFSFFTGIPLADCSRIDLPQLLNVYGAARAVMAEQEEQHPEGPYAFKGELWYIAPPEVNTESKVTFNEFLVSKEVVRQLHAVGEGIWAALPYLCCVYLRKEDEPFTEALAREGGDRYQLMMELPLDIALAVTFFFEQLNAFIQEHFSLFQPGKSKGPDMAALFERWGWISFLTMIAESGIFTIPGNGLNAIDNAKAAKLYDVLVYASEKKDSETIVNEYYESLNK
jgi:hypothetical protein